MTSSLPVVETEYAMPGCIDGCRFRLPDTEQRREAFDEKRRVRYIVHEVAPHCEKDGERISYRAAIYKKAYQKSNAASDRCKSFWGKMRARKRAWKEVTSEWTDCVCPFFEVAEEAN